MTVPIASTPRNSIDGKKTEKIRWTYVDCARLASLSASNSAWKRRSRLNACTTAIPATDSAICAVTAAIRFRCSTFAACETRWNHRERMSVGGRTTNAISPRRQSAMRSAMTAAGRRMTFETRVGIPCESTSETASTSLVRRAMIQPAFCCEK